MIPIKLTQVGNSVGAVFPKEASARTGRPEGRHPVSDARSRRRDATVGL